MSDEANARPHRASYSPQDDKLRLFFAFRIPRPEWDKLREAGWTWTMKQDSDMCAPWTPAREDQALQYADEIEDEDEPREARSADRAERFSGYMEKREGEAEELADRYDGAPRVHAGQDEGRAQRAAARHDRIGTRAADKWSTAEYWAERTRGVIAHALYLERADVRHRRIKGIEAEVRSVEARIADAAKRRKAWLTVASIADPVEQLKAARYVANYTTDLSEYQPNPARRATSLYYLLREDEPEATRISGAQAAALYLEKHDDPERPGAWGPRWINHLRLRLAYEVQMLEAQGGTLANATEIIPGGFVGRHQVVKVSKDRAGRVSKLYFLAPSRVYADRNGKPYGEDNPPPLTLHEMHAEKLGPDDYRAPTAEELAAFEAAKKERAKGKPKAPPLLNPDDASAARIQAAWNAARLAEWTRVHPSGSTIYKPPGASTVAEMTQDVYTKNSGGTYSRLETVEVHADGEIRRNVWSGGNRVAASTSPILCRLRVVKYGDGENGPPRVVVITDKPRHAVPEFVSPVAAVAVAS